MSLLNQLAVHLKVDGPVTNRLFVASIDFKVDELKLNEVFAMAGNISTLSLFRDRDGKSRGMAVIEYETPYEALNAVSMLNRQQLMERQLSVRFDNKPPEALASNAALLPDPYHLLLNSTSSGGLKSSSSAVAAAVAAAAAKLLPSGLKSIGSGLIGGSGLTTNMPPPSSYGNGLTANDAYYNGYNKNNNNESASSSISHHRSAKESSSGSSLLSNGNGNSYNGHNGGGSRTNNNNNGSSSSGHLHVNSNSGSGDIRIVSSSSNGSLSISNRIGGYSSNNNNNSNSNSSSSRTSSSTTSSSYSTSRSTNSSSNGGGGGGGSSSSKSHNSKVFVKNIPFSWDDRRLKEKFRQAGQIEEAEIRMFQGKSRGCGLIRFAYTDQAKKAVELFNNARFEGRTLEVKIDEF